MKIEKKKCSDLGISNKVCDFEIFILIQVINCKKKNHKDDYKIIIFCTI